MMAGQLEILVEEASMEEALRVIVPRIAGGAAFGIYSFQCKQELLKELPARLRGYRKWIPADHRILVVVDRDADDCVDLKRKLEDYARQAGFATRTTGRREDAQVVNRLAIEELESWFFGDWEAVRSAYPRVHVNLPAKRGYRDPDAITGGTWEALERVLQRAGYYRTGMPKVEVARNIAKHMDPERNRSRSFQQLRRALLDLVP